jgi:cytochrome b pre-mRNA-processing protein 3
MIGFFKKQQIRTAQAHRLYASAVAQARQVHFYEELGVPDSFDGRFDMISLHCFFVMNRLEAQRERALSQKVFDVFFKDMDVSLRELGVGDVGIPKHMKRMMKGFNGRAINYALGVSTQDDKVLAETLICNVYGTVKSSPNDLTAMISYIYRVTALLNGVNLLTEDFKFPRIIEKETKKSA